MNENTINLGHNTGTQLKETIETAIESIALQTYPNLEIIVIDDNSTDKTEGVVKALIKKYPCISYYALPFDDPKRFSKSGRNVNAGYAARNYGFEKARGEWITFQDADDASLLNRIEVQYELAKKYSAVHVCIDWQKFDRGLLGKKLDVDKIIKEKQNIIIEPKELIALAKKTKGILIPYWPN